MLYFRTIHWMSFNNIDYNHRKVDEEENADEKPAVKREVCFIMY